MANPAKTVRTLDEYSYIVDGRKVTVRQGQVLYERDRPNERWVYVSYTPELTATKFCFPSRLIALMESDENEAALSFTPTYNQTPRMTSTSQESVIKKSDDVTNRVHQVRVASALSTTDSTSDDRLANMKSITSETSTADDFLEGLTSGNSTSETSGSMKSVRSSEKTAVAQIDDPENLDIPELHRWRKEIRDGVQVYIDQGTNEEWIHTVDDSGRTYFYESDSRQSVWALHDLTDELEVNVIGGKAIAVVPISSNADKNGSQNGSSFSENTSSDEYQKVDSKASDNQLLQSLVKIVDSKQTKLKTAKGGSKGSRASSNKNSLVLSTSTKDEETQEHRIKLGKEHISGPELNKLQHFEKREVVQLTQLTKRGKRVPKRWRTMLIAISGSWLLFFRDTKLSSQRASTVLGKAEVKLLIQQVEVTDADETDTLRKNVLKLRITGDTEEDERSYMVELPKATYESWKIAIRYAKELLSNESRLATPLALTTIQPSPTTGKKRGINKNRSPSKLDSGLLAKMREFFRNRPSLTSLQDRGILKNEPVFASTLVQICENENSDVPSYVVCSVRAIESRGLTLVGIYRVGANAASIQKLRFAVNQCNYSLNSEYWTQEIITCTFKLFLRELKEPLFTFSVFPIIKDLFSSEQVSTTEKMVETLRDVIHSMPKPHIETARIFFNHLFRVVQNADVNQMDSQNLSIIFGPSLLRPEIETMDLSLLTAVQSPCVNFCINHVVELFGPVVPPPVVS